jgi:hypothetical protein
MSLRRIPDRRMLRECLRLFTQLSSNYEVGIKSSIFQLRSRNNEVQLLSESLDHRRSNTG